MGFSAFSTFSDLSDFSFGKGNEFRYRITTYQKLLDNHTRCGHTVILYDRIVYTCTAVRLKGRSISVLTFSSTGAFLVMFLAFMLLPHRCLRVYKLFSSYFTKTQTLFSQKASSINARRSPSWKQCPMLLSSSLLHSLSSPLSTRPSRPSRSYFTREPAQTFVSHGRQFSLFWRVFAPHNGWEKLLLDVCGLTLQTWCRQNTPNRKKFEFRCRSDGSPCPDRIPAHISPVICVSPQIWPPVICVSPTPSPPSKQIHVLSKGHLQKQVNKAPKCCKILICWLTLRVCTLRNIYRTRGREFYITPLQAVVWRRREFIVYPLSHRRTLAHELADHV